MNHAQIKGFIRFIFCNAIVLPLFFLSAYPMAPPHSFFFRVLHTDSFLFSDAYFGTAYQKKPGGAQSELLGDTKWRACSYLFLLFEIVLLLCQREPLSKGETNEQLDSTTYQER